MKLLKAIEELERKCGFPYLHPASDEFKARKLGIEALRLVNRSRPYGYLGKGFLLPGETEG